MTVKPYGLICRNASLLKKIIMDIVIKKILSILIEVCRHFRLLLPLSFIGQFIHLVGGEWLNGDGEDCHFSPQQVSLKNT